jgi:UDP-N-acetylmuramyl pentapeptide phosphotransferase/UDP-N-acetylglucosamine-1-phosphate transferase
MIVEFGKYSLSLAPVWFVLAGFVMALGITWISIPTILKVAVTKGLYDRPNKRSSHQKEIPTLGGMAVFAGFTIAVSVFAGLFVSRELLFVFAGMIILFFIGLKDDILMIDPVKKLLGQIVAAGVVVVLGDIRITGFYGFLGVGDLSYPVSVLFSVFVFVILINGYNLLDGIDGLASGSGVLAALFYGGWFYLTGYGAWAVIAFSFAGSLLAFMRFNLSQGRHKIFLGDTGSLILGLVVSVMTVRFLEYNHITPGPVKIVSGPVAAMAVVILPLLDTFRIIVIRLFKGRSPFQAERSHIHHVLIGKGLSHPVATSVLLSVNVLILVVVLTVPDSRGNAVFAVLLGLSSLFLLVLSAINRKREKETES